MPCLYGQKKEDIFPNNALIGLDKLVNLVYNTSMKNKNTLTKENKMTFKLHENDKTRVMDLTRKLHLNGVDVWCKLDMNDISNCQWRFIDSPSPHVFGTMAFPLHNGGVGALINDLLTACHNHGIIKRVRHISNRNHVRLAINGRPVWTTSNGG